MRKKKQNSTNDTIKIKENDSLILKSNLFDSKIDDNIKDDIEEEDLEDFFNDNESVEDFENIENNFKETLENPSHCKEEAFDFEEKNQDNFVAGQSSMTSYMKEISQYRIVSREEEQLMFKALNEGDETMVDAIFKANAKLVPFVVKKFSGVVVNNPSMDFEDLISAGNLGLLKAIRLFDASKGYKFTTYAYNWIYAFAERAICNDANLIRIPVHLQDKARRVKKAEKELETQINRELTYEEKIKVIEDTLGNPKDVFSMEQYARYTSPISLNAIISEEDDSSVLGDFIANNDLLPEEIAFNSSLKQEILDAMKECLPERNIEILKLRFGFETGTCMTLEEVGKIFGVTRERIRQIESKSIRLLRRSRKFRHLKDYMEFDSHIY